MTTSVRGVTSVAVGQLAPGGLLPEPFGFTFADDLVTEGTHCTLVQLLGGLRVKQAHQHITRAMRCRAFAVWRSHLTSFTW